MRRTDASRILGDRYELQRRLGSGGAGTVWRALDHTLGRAVAIKLLHADLADDPAVEARFRTEATAAAQLTHPNAVQVYDVGRDDHDDYLVMELVEGPSLAVLLRDGRLPPGTAAAVGSRVASALGAAHEAGIVHRDVKPANVLLSADGRIKLADFGIARVLGEASARLTRAGTLLGTARYLAPEQLGDDPVDARADVYALGLVLYEALTGQQPFGDGSPVEVATRRLTTSLPPIRELAPEVPVELQDVVERATRREPDERPDDGRELASALGAFASDDAMRVLAKRVADHASAGNGEHDSATRPAPHRGTPPGSPVVEPPSTRAPREINAPAAPPAASPAGSPPGDVAPAEPAAGRPPRGAPDGTHAPTAVSGAPPQPANDTSAPPAQQASAAHTASSAPVAAPDRTATMPTPHPVGEPAPPSGGGSSAVRWVLVALVAIGVVVAAILVLGDGQRAGNGDGATPSPPSPETALDIVDIGDHDPPPGDLRERPDRLEDAIDGDPETFWPTESYHSAPLGGLKDGVGMWIAFDAPATLTNVEVDFTRDGGALELWIGDGAPAEDQQPSAWGEQIHEGQIDSAELRIDDLPDDVEGDTLLLWFTDLPPGGNGYRVEVRDIRVYGE